MGTAFIVSSFSAQLFGKGRLKAARRYGWYGLGLALATQALILGGVSFVDDALALLSFEPRVTELMAGYLVIRLFSGGAAVGLEAIGNFYYGLGNTRLPMLAQLLAMVLNVLLNWVLIFGNLGAPALGVTGAAYASVIATTTAFLALFACFFVGVGMPTHGDPVATAEEPTPVEGEGLPDLDVDEDAPLSVGEMLGMLRFGLPSGMNWFLEFAAFNIFINIVIGGLGTTALAAMNAVIQLNSVSFMPAFGVASAGAILVGQHIGRGDKQHARGAVFLTLGTTSAWQGAVGILYVLAPALLMRAFAGEDNRLPRARRAHADAQRHLAALRRRGQHARRGAARGRRHHVHDVGAGGDRLDGVRPRQLPERAGVGRRRGGGRPLARRLPGRACARARPPLSLRPLA